MGLLDDWWKRLRGQSASTRTATGGGATAAPADSGNAASSASPAAPGPLTSAASKLPEADISTPMDAATPMEAGTKRKRDGDVDSGALQGAGGDEEQSPPTKKAKSSDVPATPIPPKKNPKIGNVSNEAPSALLDVYVFGEGRFGELGLGNDNTGGKTPTGVKRPRLNPKLAGVVQISCGGMHAVALTSDNTILTWGLNDLGALGRDTVENSKDRDLADEEDDDNDESDDNNSAGLNPKESTPAPVNTSELDPDIKWAQVVASDNATFALTHDGRVYGWGTFRVRTTGRQARQTVANGAYRQAMRF